MSTCRPGLTGLTLGHAMQVFAGVLREPAGRGTLKQLLRAAEAAAESHRAYAAFAWAFMSCARLAACEVELCASSPHPYCVPIACLLYPSVLSKPRSCLSPPKLP